MKIDNLKEAIELYQNLPLNSLLAQSERKREKLYQNKIDFCAIVNAKSGCCSEDCKFCSQSIHYKTNVSTYPILNEKEILSKAWEAKKNGASRFSLVTSGRELTDNLLEKLLPTYKKVVTEVQIQLCASHGFITLEQAKQLKAVGVSRYHHNLEAGPHFFNKICATHQYDQRKEALQIAREGGLSLCSGGIWGLGETIEDRLEMAFDLKALDVDSVPINILNPIKGTPLENAKTLQTEEFLRSLALYRLILPRQTIRIAGGRNLLSPETQLKAIQVGVDSLMIGNYLTTQGLEPVSDHTFLKEKGFDVRQIQEKLNPTPTDQDNRYL